MVIKPGIKYYKLYNLYSDERVKRYTKRLPKETTIKVIYNISRSSNLKMNREVSIIL